MRHFLRFLSPEKRTEAKRKYHDTPAAPTAKRPLPPRPTPAQVPTKPSAAPPSRAAQKPRPAPEFGGLIERRKQSRDRPGAAGGADPAPRPVANRTPATPKSWDTRFDIDANEIKARVESGALESTGVFLASLDNSAITLADSGLFKVEEAEEEPAADKKREKRESFDPYNRG